VGPAQRSHNQKLAKGANSNMIGDDRRRISPLRLALAVVASAAIAVSLVLVSAIASARVPGAVVAGRVLSGDRPVRSTTITLYRAGVGPGPHAAPAVLGSTRTRADGSFTISYARQSATSVLYVLTGRGSAVRLAAVLGRAPAPGSVAVNERTTVAMGFSMAQFISARGVAGKAPGLQNAAAMAGDLVDQRTGGLSPMLRGRPNGLETSTLRTFNSLSNMLIPCVRSSASCGWLFLQAKPPGVPTPRGTLQAIADIARYPWHNVGRLFDLARSAPRAYRPGLSRLGRPDAWLIALRFYGDGKQLSGPGNMAIDARGNVWVTSNYIYSRNPLAPVCGSHLLFEFTPTGRYAPGSPFSGGGLSGAGFGITLDPRGHVWVGNYGFASSHCPTQPPHNSLSEFNQNGTPISPGSSSSNPGGGWTQGPLSWPQGTVSDQRGNIWIANTCNDTVTRYPDGNPSRAVSEGNLGVAKPFDIAFNGRGQAFVTGNNSNSVAMLGPDGKPTPQSPIAVPGTYHPLGIAADSRGDMWVANSGFVPIPCPIGTSAPTGAGSVTLISADGVPRSKPFTGGGITIPWGIAVDGADNVWVANFGKQRVTELCGVKPTNCPPGFHTGQAISPNGNGYGFDGLTRNTGIQIDPSGNVWIANNWKNVPIPDANPGGYEMVVFVGAARPIRTPLIGPPRPL
jgi:sugar lactone lactonase YvrE